jgi:hypothetical protein
MSTDDRNRIVRDYVAAFTRDGSQIYIANLETCVSLHQWGDRVVPLTVNDGGCAETFVCSPQVGYIDYPLEELAHFPNRMAVPLLRAVINGVGALLRCADANRIVHINNWMTSTNLPASLDPDLASPQTAALIAAHPSHILAMRSLTRRHNAALIDALSAAGWMMIPSRQIFLIDDVARDSLTRRDTKRDHRLWLKGDYNYQECDKIDAADAARIITLYDMLYLEKYSRLNPHYTAQFVLMTQQTGAIRYLVLRDAQGVIQGFGGMHHLGDHATMPLIGYNTQIDQKHGLYRLTCHAGSLYAAHRGLKFNMSSGATTFKMTRGATAEIEYTAYFVRHLPREMRLPFVLLHSVGVVIGIPILKKYHL